MADARSAQTLDLSRFAQIPFGAAQASLAAGERAMEWLGAAAVLHAGLMQQWVASTAPQVLDRASVARPGIPPTDTPAGLAAREREMAFAVALMNFDVGMTWLLRFSEALRSGRAP